MFPVVLLLLYSIIQLHAWHDEGHMLVATIAKLQLSSEDILILENTLKQFGDFPDFNSIITAAVWPDFLKSHQGFVAFNQWHYVPLIYNPENRVIPLPYAALPYPGTGSVWALSTLFGPEIPFLLKKQNLLPEWYYNVPPKSSGMIYTPWNPIYNNHYKIPFSSFIWNLKLRFLIHVFGDMHQPLHACEYFSSMFPKGAKGGLRIHLCENHEHIVGNIRNLHDLWDTCGGQFRRKWNSLTDDELIDLAKHLMSKYPNVNHLNHLNNSFYSIALESHDFCKRYVFREFPLKLSEDVTKTVNYCPSKGYIDMVKDICVERVVYGGYRLALLLKDLARILKPDQWVQKDDQYNTNMNEENDQIIYM